MLSLLLQNDLIKVQQRPEVSLATVKRLERPSLLSFFHFFRTHEITERQHCRKIRQVSALSLKITGFARLITFCELESCIFPFKRSHTTEDTSELTFKDYLACVKHKTSLWYNKQSILSRDRPKVSLDILKSFQNHWLCIQQK